MHELAITQSIVETVAERAGGAKVTRVVVEIGRLSGVFPDAVRFCFDVCARTTTLEGAALEIREIDGLARCRDCAAQFPIAQLGHLCACGSANLELAHGHELKIREMEICDV
jgi:hydrogenase nickel incorporation protein HypA/HybF